MALNAFSVQDLQLQAVRASVTEAGVASEQALREAHDAWQELERAGMDVIGHAQEVGIPDDVKAAVKKAELLTRDRVILASAGHFRSLLETMGMMNYVAAMVSSNSLVRVSQLLNAFPKVCGGILVKLMGTMPIWEKFARTLLQEQQPDGLQVYRSVIHNLHRFGIFNGSPQADVYAQMMRLPGIVQAAASEVAEASVVNLAAAYQALERELAYAICVDPVRELMNASVASSLKAVQHMVAAWAALQDSLRLGPAPVAAWCVADRNRKVRELEERLLYELLMVLVAHSGACVLWDFGSVIAVLVNTYDQNLVQEDLPVLIQRLQPAHWDLQKKLLVELMLDELPLNSAVFEVFRQRPQRGFAV